MCEMYGICGMKRIEIIPESSLKALQLRGFCNIMTNKEKNEMINNYVYSRIRFSSNEQITIKRKKYG